MLASAGEHDGDVVEAGNPPGALHTQFSGSKLHPQPVGFGAPSGLASQQGTFGPWSVAWFVARKPRESWGESCRSSIAQSGGETYEKDTKLHQRRHIVLDPQTIAMLTTYQQARAAQAGASLTDEGFVFSPRADATTYPVPDALSRQYHHLVTQLGIRTTLHKLRHYSATRTTAAPPCATTSPG